jgi:CHAT domain-containing protein
MTVVGIAALLVTLGFAAPQDAELAIASIHQGVQGARDDWDAGKHDAARERLRAVWEQRGRQLDLGTKKGQTAVRALGNAAATFGDVGLADRVWRVLHDHCARTLSEEDSELIGVRMDLARTRAMLGDLSGALELQEAAHAALARTRAEDDPLLQRARFNLAIMRGQAGDLHGELALKEQVVAVRERTLPADHPHLALALHGLAGAYMNFGDLERARNVALRALEIRTRILTESDVDLHISRHLLGAILYNYGDLRGALALQERVLPALVRILPANHPHIRGARINLAATRKEFGDLIGARVLEEEALAATEGFPDENRDRLGARANLAWTLFQLGDPRALAMQEEVVATRAAIEPTDSYFLATARQSLAQMRLRNGDIAGAAALLESLDAQLRDLPAQSLQRLMVLLTLAATREAQGRGEDARALREAVLEAAGPDLRNAHPPLQQARGSLAWQLAREGDRQRAGALARERAAAACAELWSWTRSPRERGERAHREQSVLDQLLTFVAHDDQWRKSLAEAALAVSQTLRGVEMRTARAARRARSADPERVAELEATLREAVAEITRLAGAKDAADLAARDRQLSAAVLRREEAQRALLAIAAPAQRSGGDLIAVADLAAHLPPGTAACAVVGYRHYASLAEDGGAEERLVAFVVRGDGTLELVPLGVLQVVEDLVAALRAAVAGDPRGERPPGASGANTLQTDLRKLVLDPILAAIGDAATLFVSLDEALQLVPLDALPDDDGVPIGQRIEIRPVVSLLDLLEDPAAAGDGSPSLLVCGGIEYDARGETDVAAANRTGRPDAFRALLDSEQEAKLIARYFEKTFPDGSMRLLTGSGAGKTAVLGAAAQATIVHLATHGYFAPPPAHAGDTVAGLSPLALAGLALSGANLPADAFGDHAGILTAEEILATDLTRCQLVTLSACDTSLGVRRAGQGYASLRAALQGAGARFVLTSLWKVGDTATMELMVDFYRRLWVERKPPHVALREARLETRRRGADFRDWAGWVLTGL